MIPEPTRDDIHRWRTRLEDREFKRALLDFQMFVYRIFEEQRRQTGLQRIRAVIQRDDVKQLDSVVEKIRNKRREDNEQIESCPGKKGNLRAYDFDDLHDLIGVKILCPYDVDAEYVAKFLFESVETLETIENSVSEGYRDDPEGYRGYHYTAYPSPGLRHDWTSLYCEIQIKTMIQEAWDAMTHDVIYKRKRATPKSTIKQFRIISDGLDNWAESAGELRKTAAELWEQPDARRRVAILSLMAQALEPLRKLRAINGKIPEISISDLGCDRYFTVEEISQINETIRSEVSDGGATLELCLVATLAALCSDSPAQTDFAIQLTDRYVMGLEDLASAEIFRADMYWAMGRLTGAVEAAERGYAAMVGEGRADKGISNHFCYYVCDAVVSHNFVPTATLIQAKTIADKLADNPTDIGDLDTAGFAKIVLGKNNEEVRCGMAMVTKDRKAGLASDDAPTQHAIKAFSDRHNYLGNMRLEGKLTW